MGGPAAGSSGLLPQSAVHSRCDSCCPGEGELLLEASPPVMKRGLRYASGPLACDGCESSHRIARATSFDQHQSWEPSFVRVQGCGKCTKAARPQVHSC